VLGEIPRHSAAVLEDTSPDRLGGLDAGEDAVDRAVGLGEGVGAEQRDMPSATLSGSRGSPPRRGLSLLTD
jgi:hypothetical protein